ANDGRGARLSIDGLWIAGGRLVLCGDFDTVTLRTATLDPGEPNQNFNDFAVAADGRVLEPCTLLIEGRVGQLRADRCILGPIRFAAGGAVDMVALTDCIIQEPRGGLALEFETGRVELRRCSVLGGLQVHQLDASECILHRVATVSNVQQGCVRFCSYATGSVLPRRYESVQLSNGAALFTSLRFSQPGFAQLASNAPTTVSAGAPDGSEMGAFCREKNAVKERSLLIKYGQYMPIGLTPVIVYAT
ncbi:MAG TPA: hypothetical protein VMF89_21225, partial [Polyangiales bacterium]|nr:hypothetical protein [Polyangiales bacterium]